MLFTSYGFIAFFAAVLLLYYLLPQRKNVGWGLLLIASVAFYAFADLRFLPFICVTALSAYFAARWLEGKENEKTAYLAANKERLSADEKKAYKEKCKAKKWHMLLLLLFFDLGILAVTKYTNFVWQSVLSVVGRAGDFHKLDLIVPMGISFYTFKTVSYVIDVYRGRQTAERNFLKLLLFVTFFPQAVQGPISRYGELSPTLFSPHRFEGRVVLRGLSRVAFGYMKKLVIADRLLPAVNTLVRNPETYGGTFVLVASVLYAAELYADFTGGIDITIGIGEAMGIHMAENFNLPYFSKNIKDYWNRWHITMGTWFTDYIFYPISVCRPMLKLSKFSREHFGKNVGKRVTVYLSCFAVWFVTGLWHGAAWNFIVWGLVNFVILMASDECRPLYARFHKRFPRVKNTPVYGAFEMVRTFFMMSFVRMFDCYRDVPLTFKMLWSMVAKPDLAVFADGSLMTIGLSGADIIILLFAVPIVFAVSVTKAKVGDVRGAVLSKRGGAYALLCLTAAIVILTLLFGAYGIGYDASQFIYNQF